MAIAFRADELTAGLDENLADTGRYFLVRGPQALTPGFLRGYTVTHQAVKQARLVYPQLAQVNAAISAGQLFTAAGNIAGLYFFATDRGHNFVARQSGYPLIAVGGKESNQTDSQQNNEEQNNQAAGFFQAA